MSAGVLFAGTVMAGAPPNTSPQTQDFQVLLTISDECEVGVVGNLDFTPVGGVGFLTAALTAETTIDVGCTQDTVATVELGDGAYFLGGTRRMAGGANFIEYNLYTDAAHTTVWDATTTQQVTGDGAITGASPVLNQSLTVYGKVPAQNTGAAGAYSDTITATVKF